MTTCPEGWIPIWMILEGLGICGMFFVLFCGDSSSIHKLRMMGSFIIFTFLSVWSFIGIHWSFIEFNCLKQLYTFSSIISIMCVTFNIISIICWNYWWSHSLPCSKKKISRTKLSDILPSHDWVKLGKARRG